MQSEKEEASKGVAAPDEANGNRNQNLDSEGKFKPFVIKTHNNQVFHVTHQGVWLEVSGHGSAPDSEGNAKKKVSCTWICDPIWLHHMSANALAEDIAATFEFRGLDRQEHRLTVEDFDTGQQALVSQLRRKGLRIDKSGQFREFHLFLAALVNECRDEVDWHVTVDKIGFPTVNGQVDYSAFVLPRHSISLSGARHYDLNLETEQQLAPHYLVQGTLESWQKTIGTWAKYSNIFKLAISLALAGPMLEVLSAQTIGVHVVNSSSSGKTTVGCVAASVWGRGDEHGSNSDIKTWDATANGVEVEASQHNNLILVLDELGEAAPSTLTKTAYMLGNGRGKLRMTGKTLTLGKQYSWRLTWLSLGEESLGEVREGKGLAKGVKAGEEVRMINIPYDAKYGLFDDLPERTEDQNDTDTECAATLSNRFKAAASTDYGHAGRAFVKCLMNEISSRGRDQLRQDFAEFKAKIKSQGGNLSATAARVLEKMLVIAYAGEKAVEYGVLPWSTSDATQAVMETFGRWKMSENTREAKVTQALQSLVAIYEGEAEVYDVGNPTFAKKTPYVRKACIIKYADSRWLVLFKKTEFAEAVRKLGCGLTVKELLTELSARKAFITNAKRADYHMRSNKFGFVKDEYLYAIIVPAALGACDDSLRKKIELAFAG